MSYRIAGIDVHKRMLHVVVGRPMDVGARVTVDWGLAQNHMSLFLFVGTGSQVTANVVWT
jgi:hypothetical protein